MRVLIACERSGIVRDAFRARGHDAWSCDLEPCEGDPCWHHQMDAVECAHATHWDLMLAHPECKYLNVAGMHWTTRGLRDPQLTVKAIEFAELLWMAPIKQIAVENPVSVLSTRSMLGKSSQSIQPYEYGHDASKKTCLWLKNLSVLTKDPRQRIPGRKVIWNSKEVERWANQTDSGQNRLAPSATRSMDRARTYEGIAKAMAEQWG